MEPPSALPLGTIVDNYEVERVLSSEGSFSLVYLATDRSPERVASRRSRLRQQAALRGGEAMEPSRLPFAGPRVVLKEFFPNELAMRRPGGHTVVPRPHKEQLYGWSRGRFLDEANFLLRHTHPNVVAAFDIVSANNTHYMVMELLDGGSLHAVVRASGGQSEASIRRWLLPVLRGLQSAEQQNVHHLDLSPQNIMFRTPGGDPVLIDFGAARISASTGRASRLIVNDGYAAPEKYRLTSQGLSARADVYALAAIINFAITTERPASALERVTSSTLANGLGPAALAIRARRASARFLATVDLCFSLDPKHRPADATAMERAFGPWGEAAPERRPHTVEPAIARPSAPAEQKAKVAFLALLLLLLLLLLTGPLLASCAIADHATYMEDRRGP